MIKRILKISVLSLLFIGTVLLLISANRIVGEFVMQKPEIELEALGEISLITEQELLNELYREQLFNDNMKKSDFNPLEIEEYIQKMNEVLSAEIFMELDDRWRIEVTTRRPVARVLLKDVSSFYIDENFELMGLSPYSKPKILTVTGLDTLMRGDFQWDRIINNDSLKTIFKLDQTYRISNYVCNDAFYSAQIVQVHYTPKDGFVLIPRVGEQRIIFGTAETDQEVQEKFQKLTTFYKEVVPYEGWNTYKIINLKFKDQIVAKKN